MANGTCAACGAVGIIKAGLCTRDYQRKRLHGDPLWQPAPKKRDPERYDSSGHYLHPKTCPSCGAEFMGRTDQVHCSIGCPMRGRPHSTVLAGEAHGCWRGDSVGYWGLHRRVKKARGKADHCEKCSVTDPSLSYDWASLIDDPKSIYDFAMMCRSCHRKFDNERDHQRPAWQGKSDRRRVLTADLVRDARAAYAAGETSKAIAARYGVGWSALRHALAGETWSWVS